MKIKVMENINQVLEFIRNCNNDEFKEIVISVKARINKRRIEAKMQLEVGDTVTSDHPKWPRYLGNAIIIKINNKRTKVKFSNGQIMNASHELLKPVKNEDSK